MHSMYQKARDLLRQSEESTLTVEECALMVAQAHVYATLALVDATRESR